MLTFLCIPVLPQQISATNCHANVKTYLAGFHVSWPAERDGKLCLSIELVTCSPNRVFRMHTFPGWKKSRRFTASRAHVWHGLALVLVCTETSWITSPRRGPVRNSRFYARSTIDDVAQVDTWLGNFLPSQVFVLKGIIKILTLCLQYAHHAHQTFDLGANNSKSLLVFHSNYLLRSLLWS